MSRAIAQLCVIRSHKDYLRTLAKLQLLRPGSPLQRRLQQVVERWLSLEEQDPDLLAAYRAALADPDR